MYPLRNRIQSGIHPEDYCYIKSEEDGFLFSESLSFWGCYTSVIGDGVMSLEVWCNRSDRRRPKAEVLEENPAI